MAGHGHGGGGGGHKEASHSSSISKGGKLPGEGLIDETLGKALTGNMESILTKDFKAIWSTGKDKGGSHPVG